MPRVAVLAFGLLLIPAVCLGQNPAGKAANEPVVPQAPTLPAMVAPWPQPDNYQRPVADSRELVYRNAAWKAEQRRQRMAGYAWMGHTPLRPIASPVPIMGNYGGFVGFGAFFPFPTVYNPGGPYAVVGQTETPTSR